MIKRERFPLASQKKKCAKERERMVDVSVCVCVCGMCEDEYGGVEVLEEVDVLG